MPPEGAEASDSEREKLIMSSSMEPELTWDDNSEGVEEFLKNWNLPQVVKLHGGNYGNFGTGTNVNVQKPFLLYTSRRRSKVSATSLYWDDTQKAYVQVGPSIAIPIDYAGWFQFLLEDHKVCNYCKSIEKVAQAEPDSFLSQTPITGYRFAQDAVNGKRLYVKEDTYPGEVFSVSHLYVERVTTSKIACCFHWFMKNSFYKEKVKEVQYLHCSDSKGNEYLLPFSETGAFNPVGPVGTKDPAYVYQLEDIVRHLELPVIARLVLGQEPPTQCSFTGILRLDEIYSEETIVACAMDTEKHVLVEFPLDSDIEFIRANNVDNYIHFPDFKSTLNYCEHNLEQYMRNIKVIQTFYPDHITTTVDDTKAEDALKERSLPPTPLPLTPESELHSGMEDKIAQSETTCTEAYDSSEWDDDEDDQEEDDPCYESIPVDLRKREEVAVTTDGEEVEQKPCLPLDEEGYCVPQRTYGNMATLRAEALKHRKATKSSDDQTTENSQSLEEYKQSGSDEDQVAPCKRCVERQLSGADGQLQDSVYYNEDTLARRHYDIPPSRHHHYGSPDTGGGWTQEWLDCRANGDSIPDRLDMFLSDSVRELSRIQNNPEVDQPVSPLDINNSTVPGSKGNFVTPETKEEVDEFLDKLFDCDLMTECDYSMKTPDTTSGGQVMSKRIYLRQHSLPSDPQAWYGSLRRNSLGSKTKQGFHPNATIRKHNQISRSHVDILDDLVPFKTTASTSNPASPRSNLQDVISAFRPIYQHQPESLNDNTFSSISESSVERQSENIPLFDRDAFECSNADSGFLASPRPWSEYGGGSHRNEADMIYKAYSDVGFWNPPTDISVMSIFDVVSSLRYIGLKEMTVRRFYDEQIDGKQLRELDETLLKEGFPELNALERKKIMDFIRGWRPKK